MVTKVIIEKSCGGAVGDFYETRIEIWDDYEQLFRPVVSFFHGKKIIN